MMHNSLMLAQEGGDAAAAAGGMLIMLVALAISVLMIVCMWVVFTKAGKPGWASLIPIYNFIVLLEIVDKPLWWIILLLIPCVGIIVAIMVYIELAKRFGKGELFGVGLAFLPFIFFPILAFGDAEYR